MDEKRETIIIVGAGLAGLCTALSLAKSGYYRIELIEKRQDFSHQGATFGLAPNGIKALEELFPGIVHNNLSKTGILMETGGYMLGWWDVRDELLKRVYNDKNITLRLGHLIEQINDDPKEPEVRISFRNNDLIISGKLLIAADGVYSMIRKKLHLPDAKKVGVTIWRGNIDAYQSSSPKLLSLLEKGILPMMHLHDKSVFTLFNFHPKKRGRLIWSVSTKKKGDFIGTTPNSLFFELEDEEKEEIIQEIFDLSNQDELNTSYEMSTTDLNESLSAKGWGGKGRITLIGDAAHAIRPASGLGGSMAFEDCVVLTRLLVNEVAVKSLNRFEFCNDLVEEFEASRFDRVKIISEEEQRSAERFYNKKKNVWSDEFKQWVFDGV